MQWDKREMIKAAEALGLPNGADNYKLIDQNQVMRKIKQRPPYLALEAGLLHYQNGRPSALLAKAAFPENICDGHYDAAPTIPLVDSGKAMDQAAAMLAMESRGLNGETIPLLKEISNLKGYAMEVFDPKSDYWIWGDRENGRINTKFFSGKTKNLLAGFGNWQYDFVDRAELGKRTERRPLATAEIELENAHQIDPEQLTVQTAPFFVLERAFTGAAPNGNPKLRAEAHMPHETVAGHIDNHKVMGPMHCCRVLAQAGIVLSKSVSEQPDAVPEVVSSKAAWYDSQFYFSPDEPLFVEVEAARIIRRRGGEMVVVKGAVSVAGRTICRTDNFTYMLIPKDKHVTAYTKSQITSAKYK